MSELYQVPSLAMATTDELVSELQRRSGASVVILMKDEDDREDVKTTYYSGGIYTCLGMLRDTEHDFLSRATSRETRVFGGGQE